VNLRQTACCRGTGTTDPLGTCPDRAHVGWFPPLGDAAWPAPPVGVSFVCSRCATRRADLSGRPYGELELEECFYLRPVGLATATARARSTPTRGATAGRPGPVPGRRRSVTATAGRSAFAEEHARAILPFRLPPALRGQFSPAGVAHLSRSARSFDAQLEIRQLLCDPDLAHLGNLAPELPAWYEKKPPAQSPPSPLIWAAEASSAGGSRGHIRARVTRLGLVLIFALAIA